jgi:molybdopterin-guanine dinucleotide biosynthesis protein A
MLTVAIQAGGHSRRMGSDKALVPLLGKPMILQVYERIKSLADEVLITTNHPEDYKFLNLPLFPDLVRDRGALGGLFTAMMVAKYPIVAVVACDMPFVSPDLLAMARDRLVSNRVDAVIPRTDNGYEPLHAVYRRSNCLSAVKEALYSDDWRVISWISKVKVAFIEPQELRILDPEGITFWNINTIGDIQRAEAYLLSHANAKSSNTIHKEKLNES